MSCQDASELCICMILRFTCISPGRSVLCVGWAWVCIDDHCMPCLVVRHQCGCVEEVKAEPVSWWVGMGGNWDSFGL